MKCTDIPARVAALRAWMRQHGFSAFVFPSSDDHYSEYVAPRFQTRQWISGFDGSAGTAAVTLDAAALWTDSRYFLAAEGQLQDTPFELMREGQEGTPTLTRWLIGRLEAGARVGVDGRVLTQQEAAAWGAALADAGLHLDIGTDAAEALWNGRPPYPSAPIVEQPLAFAGEAAQSKLQALLSDARAAGCDGLLLTALDEIAWALNLRGADVACNPVFYAYLWLSAREAPRLYVESGRLSGEAESLLDELGVQLRPYDSIEADLTRASGRLWLPDEVNARLAAAVPAGVAHFAPSPAQLRKAIKNEAEQEGFRRAMARDGVALCRLLSRLRADVAAGGMTEMEVDRRLTAYRSESPLFCGLSFATISAYGPHGAIVHYEPTPETDAPLEPRGLLLLDTGAQYQDGTTDITRTVALGPLTDEERRVYTLVLKGHIALARCCFPEGATGLNIDMAARYAMWQHGYDFGHGTGHGVGSHLCVHEGPQQIRKNLRACTQVPLRSGMTLTDEPGIYLEGRFGVRIENVLLVTPAQRTECGTFMNFEVLTLCPYDFAAIDCRLLTREEMHWIDNYHAQVRRRLLPLLDADETARRWLVSATRPRFC